MFPPEQLEAVVLAGGESRRMGTPKALLPWGGSTLIEHVVALLRPLFRRVVVVAHRPGDPPLPVPGGVVLTCDAHPELRGPLVGLVAGLRAVEAPRAFVTACDMPRLTRAVVALLAREAGDSQVSAPQVGERLLPLPAVYSRDCLALAERLLERGEVSLRALLEGCRVRAVPEDVLRRADPSLDFLLDVDTPDDYRRALRGKGPEA